MLTTQIPVFKIILKNTFVTYQRKLNLIEIHVYIIVLRVRYWLFLFFITTARGLISAWNFICVVAGMTDCGVASGVGSVVICRIFSTFFAMATEMSVGVWIRHRWKSCTRFFSSARNKWYILTCPDNKYTGLTYIGTCRYFLSIVCKKRANY